LTYSHPTARTNKPSAIAYVVVNGLSLAKNTKDPMTVNSFLVVVIATAGTAPKCFTMMVYNHAPKKRDTDRNVNNMKYKGVSQKNMNACGSNKTTKKNIKIAPTAFVQSMFSPTVAP